MTAPIIPHLPTAPSRLSKPSNFVSESSVFLDALPSFRTNMNQLSTYLNGLIPNKFNFGILFGIRNFPALFQSDLTDIEYDGNSVDFASKLDILYSTINTYSGTVNLAGTWIDQVVDEVGVIPYDLDKPIVNGLVTPMTRNQSIPDFNNSATMFTTSTVDNINSLYQSMYYTYTTSCGNESCGLITDTTIIQTYDGGYVNDPILTY